MKEFSRFHPFVNFSFFVAVIGFSMVFLHPLALGLSLVLGLCHTLLLNGKKSLRFNLVVMLPLALIMVLINPLISHQGATTLFMLPWGPPLTLEALCYGFAAGAMLWSVMLHFSCFNRIMTSDKFVYLFGRLMPALSLILSMVLRFVPRFKEQLKSMSKAQRFVGENLSRGSISTRAKNGMALLSGMVTWSLENAVDTADSMKSRGYGLPHRTSYGHFRFHKRDAIALSAILLLSGYIIFGAMRGGLAFTYFPQLGNMTLSPLTLSLLFAYGALLACPIIIELWEGIKWKQLQSKI